MKTPGSWMPKGWLEWSLPPTMLRPRGPPALTRQTSCKHSPKVPYGDWGASCSRRHPPAQVGEGAQWPPPAQSGPRTPVTHLGGVPALRVFGQLPPGGARCCLLQRGLFLRGQRWWRGGPGPTRPHREVLLLGGRLSFHQQSNGGWGGGQQRYSLIVPGFRHVHPIDLQRPQFSVSGGEGAKGRLGVQEGSPL